MRRSPWPATRGAATAAKALAVTVAATVAAVALTLVAAGPAMAAAQAQVQSPAAPAKVKYYVVPPPGHGSVPTLYSIAAATLGNGSLFMEIFNLNKGRLQPNGQRLESPHSVEPGWILLLPPSASGPGVHFGPLPTAAKTAARVARRHAGPRPCRGSRPSRRRQRGLRVRRDRGDRDRRCAGRLRRRRAGPGAAQAPPAGRWQPVRQRPAGEQQVKVAGAAIAQAVARQRGDGPGADWVRSLATDTPGDAASHGGATPGNGRERPWLAYAGHPSSLASDLGGAVQGPTLWPDCWPATARTGP